MLGGGCSIVGGMGLGDFSAWGRWAHRPEGHRDDVEKESKD
jgi:hypothetical protein